MTSRQIQIIAGLAIVIAIAVGLVVIADNNRQKIAARMEAEKADTVAKNADEAASGTEEQQAAGETAEAETKADAEKPSFDVARFEPTGDGVLAGLAKPGSVVELLVDGQPISTTTANEVGEWVIVLEKPLEAGSHDLTVRATVPEGEPAISEDLIAVVVPDTPSGELLVVATRAGQPSEILSRPSTSSGSTATDGGKQADSGTATEMTSSESAAPAKPGSEGQAAAETGMASESTQGSEQETQMAATDTAPSGAAGSEEDPQKSAGQKSAAMTEGSSGENQTVDGQASNASESVAGSATEETAQASQPPAAVDTSGQQASATDPMGTETETAETASESPVPTAESTQMAAATSEANEAADTPPETNSAQSPAETAETAATGNEDEAGEMAADSDNPTSESTQMASADQDADTPLSGSLASASEQETKTAEAQGEAQSAPAPVAEAPKRVFKLALDAVETEGSMVYAAGTGNPGAKVRVYADDTFIGETAANDSGRWLLETNAEIAAGNVVVRADELASGGTDVVQRAEVPFLKQVDAIALLPTTASTGGGASKSSSGAVTGPTSVIIRKGDNLWTISRRTYGRGFRYTTIYQANDDQIRNPHMIFPGQVFVLPKGEKNWVQ